MVLMKVNRILNFFEGKILLKHEGIAFDEKAGCIF